MPPRSLLTRMAESRAMSEPFDLFDAMALFGMLSFFWMDWMIQWLR